MRSVLSCFEFTVDTKHSRRREGKSGGDLGIVFIRPNIIRLSTYRFDDDEKHGLLCQAKIKQRNETWGSLTPNQRKNVLPNRLDYLSLLLYDFEDKDRRRRLKSFRWQECSGYTMKDVEAWLSKGNFPLVKFSRETIEGLASGEIGTSDPRVINEIIAKEERPTLIIKIGWPDDTKPESLLQYLEPPRHQQKVKILQSR